ncbi:unnamed protein product [Anisakis simplex]|uniref:Putative rabb and C (inferred by orthology to a S. mansoni protein) n=1 Tax=Anisakis simplex TaxID=6269 RepID=A0A0M3JR96_ANISI|nr:unnamed protein product [Anisakis simplex]
MVLCRNDHEYLLKFLLVGDSDVGKNEITDLLSSSSNTTATDHGVNKKLPTTRESAVSSAFFTPVGTSSKTTTILLEGRRVRLQLWDTSGQGRFSTIIRSYSRGAQGILLVYDITNRWSFDGIRRWLAEIDEYAPGIPRILVGNRLHLEFNRAVSRAEAETFAHKRNMQYFEISTLVYFNVHESLTELARLVIQRNGMHWLWRTNQVSNLQDLCCRAVVACVKNIHAIERLPLPAFLKFKVRSFAQGAEVCMGSLQRRHHTHHGNQSAHNNNNSNNNVVTTNPTKNNHYYHAVLSDVTPRPIARFVQASADINRRRLLRSGNCKLM